MRHSQEWESRKEIPNPQIKDVADQYEKARRILFNELPGSGVLFPLMNSAAVAIELYLKCLSAEVVHVINNDFEKSATVYAQPPQAIHRLASLFNEIPDEIRCTLVEKFRKLDNTGSECFEDTLGKIEGTLMYARYPYEPDNRFKSDLKTVVTLSAFLHEFVAGLEPREWIQWKC